MESKSNNTGGGIENLIKQAMPYFSNQSQGDIRPKRKPVYQQPPHYINKCVIGLESGRDRYYSTLKFWIQKPTLQYPNTAVKIQFSNASYSVFSIISTKELHTIREFIDTCIEDGERIVKELQPMEKKMIAAAIKAQEEESLIMTQAAPQLAQVAENLME